MPIVVQCPKCNSKLRAPDEIAGKKVRCPSCQEKLQVPVPDNPGEVRQDTQQLSPASNPAPVPASPSIPAKADSPATPTVSAAEDVAVFVPTAIDPKAISPQPEPEPLDDLALEEVPTDTASVAKAEPARAVPATPEVQSLSVDDLVVEPAKFTAPQDDFTFEDPTPAAPVKKKKRRRDEEDEDEEIPVKKPKAKSPRPDPDQKKAGPPLGILIGGGVLLLVLGAGAAILFLGGGKKDVADSRGPSSTHSVGSSKLNIQPRANETETPKPTDGGENASGTGTGPKGPGNAGTTPPVPKIDPVTPAPVAPVVPVEPTKPPSPPPPTLPEPKLPAPPGAATKIFSKAKRKIPLQIPLDKIRDIQVGKDSIVVAFNSLPSFQGLGGKDTIRLYGLTDGAKGREFVIDSTSANWTSAYAVSASDGLVAIENGGPGKVSVYDFEKGSFVLDKQDVFAEIPGRMGPIAALALGANRKLFVVDQAGAVDIWDLTTRQRAVTGTPPKRTGRSAPKACMMKNGTTLALAMDASVWAIDVTGTVKGLTITLADPASTPLAMGSSHAPDRVVLAYQLPDGKTEVAALRPLEGQIQFLAILPKAVGVPTQVSWPSDTLLSVTTSAGEVGLLVDLTAKGYTGYVKPLNTNANLFSLTREYWWCLPDPQDAKKSLLISVDMPFAGYPDVVKKAGGNKTPIYLVPQADGLAQ